MTIVMGGTDIGIALLVKLRKFIKEEYIVLCREGGPLTHKHFQMVVDGNFTSLLVLNKQIKVCLRWDVSPHKAHVVSCEKLREVGLHTFMGMVSYCRKDNGK